MNTNAYLSAILAIGLLAALGCKKSEQPSAPPAEYHGVKVDVPKLDVVFANASQEVLDRVTVVKRFFRYGQFPQAVVELDNLSQMPNLTEPQKKLVNDLIEQTKQAIAKASAPPGQ